MIKIKNFRVMQITDKNKLKSKNKKEIPIHFINKDVYDRVIIKKKELLPRGSFLCARNI